MNRILPIFLLLACTSSVVLVAQSSADKALQYLESRLAKKGLLFDRTKIRRNPESPNEFTVETSNHSIWGKDPITGSIEGLVLFTPSKAGKRGLLVWVKEGPKETWIHRDVTTVKFTPQSAWRVWALSADSLAQYQRDSHFSASQNIRIPAAPIEFHLDDSEEGLSTPAQVFHPDLGIALVVNGIQDDSAEPVPPGQTWGTHARGESIDLPSSAFKRAKFVLRQHGRVWFRLAKGLYVADESEWDLWVDLYGSKKHPERLTPRSSGPDCVGPLNFVR